MKDVEIFIKQIEKFCLKKDGEINEYTAGVIRGMEMALELIKEKSEELKNE